MRFTEKDLKALQAKGLGMIGDLVLKKHSSPPHLPKVLKPEAKGVLFMQNVLEASGLAFSKEHKGIPGRLYRFDFAIHSLMVAIEYEGLNSTKSRHTTLSGYTWDCDKYNLAALHGWKVLRYTAMNYRQFETDLKILST